MGVDCGSNIWHTSVGHFNGVAVEYLAKSVMFGKMGVQKMQKLSSDVRFDSFAKWRVIPYNVLLSIPSSSWLRGFILQYMGVAASS